MKTNIAAICCILGVVACTSDDPMMESTQKRLYQLGCVENADCEQDGVCKQQGSDTVCYPACENQCEGGMCVDGACIPLCGEEGSCPESLICDAMGLCRAEVTMETDAGQTDAGRTEACRTNSECAPGLICLLRNGEWACTPDCAGSFDCPAASGQCAEGPEGTGCFLSCSDNPDNCPNIEGYTASCINNVLCGYTQ